jgi:S1-C subfamily serine protease
VDITARGTTRVASPFGSTREPSTSTGSGIVVDRRGDILTADHVVRGASSVSIAVGGRLLRGVNDLTATVSARRPGQAITLAVQRHGRRLTLHVVLAARPRAASAG